MSAPWLKSDSDSSSDGYQWSPLLQRVHEAQEIWTAMTSELRRLQLENAELKEKVWSLSKRVEAYQAGRTTVAEIPPEILLCIFRDALPPWWMTCAVREPTPASLYTIDLKQKTSLARVCRSWNAVANEMLYGRVHLRSIGQVAAFSRTIQQRNGLAQLVQQIDLSCFVPPAYDALFAEETANIFTLCPRLGHIGFVPIYKLPSTTYLPLQLKENITSLEFSQHIDFDLILVTLAHLQQRLRRLSLAFTEDSLETQPPLEFPILEELRIIIATDDSNEDEPVIWSWSMPILQRLWLSTGPAVSSLVMASSLLRHAPQILANYGSNVTFLSLTLTFRNGTALEDIFCPKLQHLVITTCCHRSPHVDECALLVRGHPALEYLDIWCLTWGKQDHLSLQPNIPHITQADLRAKFPALRKCRIFDGTFVHFADLNLEFPPSPPRPLSQPRFLGEFDFRPAENICATHSAWIHTTYKVQHGAYFARPPWLSGALEFVEPGSAFSDRDFADFVQFADSDDMELDSDEDPDWEPDSDEESDGGSCTDSDSEAWDSGESESDMSSDSQSDTNMSTDFESVDEDELSLADEMKWEIDRAQLLEIFSDIVRQVDE
ncbi:F-box domain-containing protein [Mycena chlorophos]|uniref:F-box domain-containing protein n=1 Tax=Mycena chlorophos TaxID=658473 RepID=A0A8H6SUV8_MYCCL|nr:F-box domain-containing protein [Mycena chlorophos]